MNLYWYRHRRREDLHVLPLNDLIEHAQDADCPCGPTQERHGPNSLYVLHHSLDGREQRETQQ